MQGEFKTDGVKYNDRSIDTGCIFIVISIICCIHIRIVWDCHLVSTELEDAMLEVVGGWDSCANCRSVNPSDL